MYRTHVSESARTTGQESAIRGSEDRSDILAKQAPQPVRLAAIIETQHPRSKCLRVSQMSPSFLTLYRTREVEITKPGYDSVSTDPGKGGKK